MAIQPRVRRSPLGLYVIFLVFAQGLLAQTASLTGAITDPTGGVVISAKIIAVQTEQNIKFETTANDSGLYLFQNLPIGSYQVEAEAAGFKTFRQSGIKLTVDSRQLLNIHLEVGATTEVVNVVGEAVRVDTVAPTLQQLVDARRIVDLPLNGRNVYGLSQLVPGVLPGGGVGSISGGRNSGEGGTTVNVRLDGALNVEQNFASILPAPPPDAVQEFTIQTSVPSAKYLYSSGVIEIATKSGTNELHGTLYDFFRNDALDARNFFAATKTKRKRNQYGFTAGGPAMLPGYDGRNRSFFFVGFEQQKEPLGAVRTIFVPTTAQRTGNFSSFATKIRDAKTGLPFPGNIIPPDRLDPLALNLLKEFVPTAQDESGRYTFFAPADNNPTQVIVRGDHTQGKNLFTWRGYLTRNAGPANFGNLPFWSGAGTSVLRTDIHTFSWTRSLTPSTANVFRFSYNKWRTGTQSDFTIATPEKLRSLGWSPNFVNGVQPASFNFFPRLDVSGFVDFSTVLPRIIRGSDTFTFEDDFSIVRGRHNLQIGTRMMRAYQDDGAIVVRAMGSYSFSGQFTGSPLTDFMTGLPNFFEQQNEQGARALQNTLGFYAQDDIKLNRRLSLTIGLRYDLPFAPVERDGKEMVYRPWTGQRSKVFPNAPIGLLFKGDPGVPTGRETVKRDFGPRIGLVYALTNDQKTVLRAGYGLLYNPQWTNLNEQFANKQPWINRIQLSPPPSTSDPWAGFPGGNPFPTPPGINPHFIFANATIFSYAPGYRDPDMQQWNVNIQREIAKDWLITAAYAGTKGTHLALATDYNPARFLPGNDPVSGQPLSTPANLNARRPYYPPLTRVVWYLAGGTSSYHSLQMSLDKRFSHGFSLLTSYTLSKSLDLMSANFDTNALPPQDPGDFRAERGPSSWDRTHAFVNSVVWEVPHPRSASSLVRQVLGGWSLTTILRLYSGTPLGITESVDNALRGLPNRPNRVRDPRLSDDRSRAERIAKWFDTTAYVPNARGEFGSAPRTEGQLRGPGMVTFDIGILKHFPITDRQRLEFRAEFFNLPNHANFGNPQTNFNSSAFGRISSAADPRITQFALKYWF